MVRENSQRKVWNAAGARPGRTWRAPEPETLVRLLCVRPTNSSSEGASPEPFVASEADDCSSKDRLTGAVLSCGTHLIYVLEGWEQRVADVMVKIFNDRSHGTPVVVEQVIAGARRFGKWSRLHSQAASYFERCIGELKDAPAAERIKHVERLVEVVRVYAAD